MWDMHVFWISITLISILMLIFVKVLSIGWAYYPAFILFKKKLRLMLFTITTIINILGNINYSLVFFNVIQSIMRSKQLVAFTKIHFSKIVKSLLELVFLLTTMWYFRSWTKFSLKKKKTLCWDNEVFRGIGTFKIVVKI